jgi:hypothetical protein
VLLPVLFVSNRLADTHVADPLPFYTLYEEFLFALETFDVPNGQSGLHLLDF